MSHDQEKTKKILYVITKSNFGGAQRYVFDLASYMHTSYDVCVAFGGHGFLETRLHKAGIRTLPLNFASRDINIFSDFHTLKELIRLFRKESPDIVHLNSSKIGLLGSIAARIARVPRIVFTAHGWPSNEQRPLFYRIIFIILQWLTVKCSHKTIAVSEQVRKDMARYPGMKKRIETIRNGIDQPDFINRETARNILNIKKESFVIGTIAELHKNKGLEYLIRGFAIFHKIHPQAELMIIGEGEEHKKLEALRDSLSLTSSVHLKGFVEDAARYLRSFDIFTLTSQTEALGYVILEAGTASLPVVASKVGGIPEIIEDEQTGILILPKNPEMLAQAFKRLLDPEISANYGRMLRKKVLDNFSIKTMAEHTKVVYTK